MASSNFLDKYERVGYLGAGVSGDVELWQVKETKSLFAAKFLIDKCLIETSDYDDEEEPTSDDEEEPTADDEEEPTADEEEEPTADEEEEPTAPLHDVPNEVRIMRKLDHARCVKMLDFEKDPLGDAMDVIRMEFCEGGSLGRLRAYYVARQEPVPEELLWQIFVHLSEGVNFMHHGPPGASDWEPIWHNDIKPDNILFKRPQGENLIPDFKLADFGHSTFATETFRTEALGPCAGGDGDWAPPEFPSTGPFRDIWCIGVTMIYMATGELVTSIYKEAVDGRMLVSDFEKRIPRLSLSPSDRQEKGMLSGMPWDARYSALLDYWTQQCLKMVYAARVSSRELVTMMVPLAQRKIADLTS